MVTDIRTILAPDRVELHLDEAAFPRDAVYGAAYAFTDRCYVRLDRAGEGLSILLRAKVPGGIDGEALAAEVQNELFAQSFQRRNAEDGRELTAEIVAGAFGAGIAAEPSLDDLLAGPDDAFDASHDPLGIAQSWEEKYAKKTKGEPSP